MTMCGSRLVDAYAGARVQKALEHLPYHQQNYKSQHTAKMKRIGGVCCQF
jgi:hypothetical protein